MRRNAAFKTLAVTFLTLGLAAGMMISTGPDTGSAIGATPAATHATAKPAPPAPSEHKVKASPIRVEVKLSGTFEAVKMTEVIYDGEVLKSLKVVKCVDHGTRVKKGDVLIEVDMEPVDRAIKAKTAANEAGGYALAAAVEELRRMEETTPQALASLIEADQRSAAAAEHFTKVSQPLAIKAAKQGLQSSIHYLEYAKEELRQLKKMYAADDLTEETEEIVLKRQVWAVERAELSLERSKAATKQTLEVDQPRLTKDWAKARRTSTENLASQKVLLPLALSQKRLAVAKAKLDHAKAVKALVDMKADRAKMVIKAPAAGIVYYGKCEEGKWSASATLLAKLAPKGAVSAGEVVMTIVDPSSLVVHATAGEKDLHNLGGGLPGLAVPTGYPALKLKLETTPVMTVPLSGGAYAVKMNVTDPSGPVMPGMTCGVTLTAYENKTALTVPARFVRADPDDATKKIVNVKGATGSERRQVKVGRTIGGKTEILSGLVKGDVVVLKGAK